MRLLVYIFFVAAVFNGTFSYAQPASKLRLELDKLRKDEQLSHAQLSVYVWNLKKNSLVIDHNGDLSLVPASTMKVVTTGAALNILGADFRFETKIEFEGIYDSLNGIVKGNIYITGGGDPTLASEYFRDKKDSLSVVQRWALILKEKGIKKVEGKIIADAGVFEDNTTPSQWIWGDMGNYYGAGASGLTYMDNKITFHFVSKNENTSTQISKVTPDIKGLKIINNVTAGGKKDNAYVYASPYDYRYMVEGNIPPNRSDYEVDAAMPDPALYCAQSFYEALIQNKIIVTDSFSTVRILKEASKYKSGKRVTFFKHYSPPLEKIVYYTNLKSNNLYAEHLLKYICYKQTGMGEENEGTVLVTEYWKTRGVDVGGMFMNDGCGLARANAITTKTQVQILRLISQDKSFQSFYNSLPVAGKSGSLGGLCEGSFAENNLRAKSGYITRARSYCGYVKNRKGEMVSFSVIVNNYSCTAVEMKSKLEKILVAIAETE